MSISSNSHQKNDSKFEFTQKKFFIHFNNSPHVCKRYYSKKSKHMKNTILDKRILTKTHLRVMIWKNFKHHPKSPIVWTFLAKKSKINIEGNIVLTNDNMVTWPPFDLHCVMEVVVWAARALHYARCVCGNAWKWRFLKKKVGVKPCYP